MQSQSKQFPPVYRVTGSRPSPRLWLILLVLALTTLACGLFGGEAAPRERTVRIRRLPTLTPTPALITSKNTPAQSLAPLAPASNSAAAAVLATPIPNPTSIIIAPAIPTGNAISAEEIVEQPVQPVAVATTVPMENAASIEVAAAQPAQVVAVATATLSTNISTPTLSPTIQSTPTAIVVTPTPIPSPTLTATPTAALTFSRVRLHSDPDRGGLFLYGDIVNQSDSPQELKRVTGTFLDAQGQIVADETNTSDYSPIQIVPGQGQVPFELVVDNIQSAADFELRAEAEPSSDTLRQDFEITDSYQDNDEFGLCVGGTLRNPGGDLTQYVVVAAILYDAQDNVISFGDTYFEPGELASGQTGEFEVCADSFNQAVSRYELQAWGQ